MADAAVAADLHQTLDVQRHIAALVAFHDQVMVDILTDLSLVLLGHILYTGIRIDAGGGENVVGSLTADAVDIGECDFHPLFSGQVYTSNSCHSLVHLRFVTLSPDAAYAWDYRR